VPLYCSLLRCGVARNYADGAQQLKQQHSAQLQVLMLILVEIADVLVLLTTALVVLYLTLVCLRRCRCRFHEFPADPETVYPGGCASAITDQWTNQLYRAALRMQDLPIPSGSQARGIAACYDVSNG
jgi:hypothetical protein